ncbi:WD40_repeat protein [Hexamita inflata]|uniref:WD40 repeat protein n=1 Tax=Hexamita inflata TaxID=28002 RepID=A0AA86QDX4_9EUKA|nr:WD40 repeat protein [Hexamita inflata]
MSQHTAETQENDKKYEVPTDVQRILETNYEIPTFSDDEAGDEADDLTLDVVQKPVIAARPESAQTVLSDTLVNNATIEDYLKNTLSQLNLVKTLNQFQSEYLEMSRNQSGQRKLQQMNQSNSQLLAENMQLKFQVDQLTLQNEKIVNAAVKAKEQFMKLRQQRDFHRTKHRQVVQEKQVLVNDLRRLREHCQLYQPLIMELNTRYDKLLRQKQLTDIARDKAQNELKKIQMNQPVAEQQEAPKQTTKPKAIQQIAPTSHFKNSYVNPFTGDCELLNQTIKYQISGATVKAHDAAISSIAFHRSLQVCTTASADGSFKVFTNFNAPSPNQLMVRGQPHSSYVTGAKFNTNNNFQSILASCAGDGTVKLFNISNQTEVCALKTLPSVQAWGLDWHCEGRVLAVANSDKSVRLYDLNMNQVLQEFDQGEDSQPQSFSSLRGATRAVTNVQFQPYGNLLQVSGADGITRVYDPRANTVISQIKLNNACKACFDLSGQYIAAGDLDGNLIMQDMRTSKALFKLQVDTGINCLSFGNKQNGLLIGTKKGMFCSVDGTLKQILRTESFQCESCDYNTVSGGFAVGTSDGQMVFLI